MRRPLAELSDPDADLKARIGILSNVAAFQASRGEYVSAEAKFAEVLKLKTKQLGAEDLGTLQAADTLALVMRHQAKYIAAESPALQTLPQKEKLFGRESSADTEHITYYCYDPRRPWNAQRG